MDPQTLDLDPITEAASWEGIPAMTIQRNEAPPDAALTSVEMRFQRTDIPANQPAEIAEINSDSAEQIQIVSAANWEISMPEQVLPLVAGNWRYVLITTDANGKPWVYVVGTILVKPTVKDS